jgi:hypothetical protein
MEDDESDPVYGSEFADGLLPWCPPIQLESYDKRFSNEQVDAPGAGARERHRDLAAARLGMKRSTLQEKMRKLGISRPQ